MGILRKSSTLGCCSGEMAQRQTNFVVVLMLTAQRRDSRLKPSASVAAAVKRFPSSPSGRHPRRKELEGLGARLVNNYIRRPRKRLLY